MIEIVSATIEHAREIDLRPGDRREIEALGLTMPEAFEISTRRALWADAYLIDGEVAALVGLSVNNALAGWASPWLVTGTPVDGRKKAFLRETSARVATMAREWPLLTNYVLADYRETVRWLEWLGFTIHPPRPVPPFGVPFRLFSMGPVPEGVA